MGCCTSSPFKERVIGSDYVNIDPDGESKWNVKMDRQDDCGKANTIYTITLNNIGDHRS